MPNTTPEALECCGCGKPIERKFKVGNNPKRCADCLPERLTRHECGLCGCIYQSSQRTSLPTTHWRRSTKYCPTCFAIINDVRCVQCGALRVAPGRTDRKYCSRACYNASRQKRVENQLTICRNCGSEITSRRGRQFCNQACRKRYLYWSGREFPECKCEACGATISNTKVARVRRWCSVPCKRAGEHAEKYGISPQRYLVMIDKQNGRCAICGSASPGEHVSRWAVDHDHRCCSGVKSCGKCVRGLLCIKCNSAAGLLGDSASTAQAMAAYLAFGGMRQPQR